MVLSEEARAVITSGRLAHLVTINPDGSPQTSCVWVGLDGDDIVFASLQPRRKLDNLRRDPRCVLSVETDRANPIGLVEYLVVHGRARVTEGGGADLLQRLAGIYIGPGVRFPPMDDPPPGWIARITPERLGGVGPWAG